MRLVSGGVPSHVSACDAGRQATACGRRGRHLLPSCTSCPSWLTTSWGFGEAWRSLRRYRAMKSRPLGTPRGTEAQESMARRRGRSPSSARRREAFAESEALCTRACALWDKGRNKQAFALFRAAAQMGDDGAYLNVGYCYDVGKGVRKNLSRAMLWYKRASRRGDGAAAHNVGIIYRDKGEFGLARRWFRRAIDKGEAGSAVDLAKLYLGRGRPLIARRYLTFAVSQFDSMSEYEFEEAERLLDSLNQSSVSSGVPGS